MRCDIVVVDIGVVVVAAAVFVADVFVVAVVNAAVKTILRYRNGKYKNHFSEQ